MIVIARLPDGWRDSAAYDLVRGEAFQAVHGRGKRPVAKRSSDMYMIWHHHRGMDVKLLFFVEPANRAQDYLRERCVRK